MPRCPWRRRNAASDARSSTATATTATADTHRPDDRRYVGRFAPSPTGDLHLGSLYAAAASYLDARAHGGLWRLRMEDLDRPREVQGASGRILRTLEAFGFEWDGECLYQNTRTAAYRAALADLEHRGLTFACSCSRSQLSDETRYPGTCRPPEGCAAPGQSATRLRVTQGHILFHDRLQGDFRQDVASVVGDFVVQRRDGIFAYVLAVVIDDAAQGITDVVRGADLLDNTPRQIYLQRLLALPTPRYAHVPVLCEAGGAKLAKSRRSISLERAVAGSAANHLLLRVFGLLGLAPSAELDSATIQELWTWATQAWSIGRLPHRLALNLGT